MHCPYIKKGITIKHNGDMIPCCFYQDRHDLNVKNMSVDTYFKNTILVELEKKFKNNQWPSGCIGCKTSEENGQTSMRLNAIALESRLFEKHYIDLDIGDECNADCAMCSPGSSSKIRSRIKNQGNINELEYDLTKSVTGWSKEEKFWIDLEKNIDSIGCIKFLGGEPFIIKNIWNWLEKESVQNKKHNIVLQITTNASILPSDKINLLEGWKELIINISVDATEQQFEWIRHGLNWNTVNSNTKKLIKLNRPIVSIQFVASIYSITGAYDLLKWINELECLFTFIHLKTPKFLALKYAPVDVLNSTLDQLSQIKMKKIQNQINLNSLKKFIKKSIQENEYNPVILKNLTEYFNNHRVGIMDPNTLKLTDNEK